MGIDASTPIRVRFGTRTYGGLDGGLPALANASLVGLAVGDLDGDDQPDLAYVDAAGALFGWYQVDDDGGLYGATDQEALLGCAADKAHGLRLAATRVAGTLDAVTACGPVGLAGANAQLVTLLNPSLGLASPSPSPAAAATSAFTAVSTALSGSLGAGPFVVGDFDGDGHLDVVAAPAGSGATASVTALYGDGSGRFTAGASFAAGTDDAPNQLAVGDANGDGVPDLVTLEADDSGAVLVGKRPSPAPTPHAYTTTTLLLAGADTAGTTLLAPVLSAGRDDLLVIDVGGGETDVTVSLHLDVPPLTPNNAAALFNNPESYPLDPGPQCVCTGDFDGDGSLDLAVGTYDNDANTEVIDLLFNNGSGHFAFVQKVAVPIIPGQRCGHRRLQRRRPGGSGRRLGGQRPGVGRLHQRQKPLTRARGSVYSGLTFYPAQSHQ